MAEATPKMKPIWYFVGLILLAMGGVILLTGLYHLFFGPIKPFVLLFPRDLESWLSFDIVVKVGLPRETVLGYLHPEIWWGGFMALSGTIFVLIGRRSTAE